MGYEISKSHCDTKLTKDSIGRRKRSVNGSIQLLVPGQVIRDKLKPFKKNGKPYPFVARNNYPVMDIISMYNAEIRGLYNYYCLATDVSRKIAAFKYYHYYSMLKTIARKEKSTVGKVYKKYGIEVSRKLGKSTKRIVGIQYETKASMKTITYFNDSLKKMDKPLTNVTDTYGRPFAGVQLIKRLNANICELCGTETKDMCKPRTQCSRKKDMQVHGRGQRGNSPKSEIQRNSNDCSAYARKSVSAKQKHGVYGQ